MQDYEITTAASVRLLNNAAYVLTQIDMRGMCERPACATQGDYILLDALLAVATGNTGPGPELMKQYEDWLAAMRRGEDVLHEEIPFY